MIDPNDVTKYDRTEAELQEYWLFCLVVAGKTAVVQARLLDSFLTSLGASTPFQGIRDAIKRGDLLDKLKESRLGQYNRLAKAMEQSLVHENRMAVVTVSELEDITGVGSKTARYYILHTRKNQQVAALDTHILAHMRDLGLTTQSVTPPKGAKYDALEAQFIALAKSSGMALADYDLMIWKQRSRQ